MMWSSQNWFSAFTDSSFFSFFVSGIFLWTLFLIVVFPGNWIAGCRFRAWVLSILFRMVAFPGNFIAGETETTKRFTRFQVGQLFSKLLIIDCSRGDWLSHFHIVSGWLAMLCFKCLIRSEFVHHLRSYALRFHTGGVIQGAVLQSKLEFHRQVVVEVETEVGNIVRLNNSIHEFVDKQFVGTFEFELVVGTWRCHMSNRNFLASVCLCFCICCRCFWRQFRRFFNVCIIDKALVDFLLRNLFCLLSSRMILWLGGWIVAAVCIAGRFVSAAWRKCFSNKSTFAKTLTNNPLQRWQIGLVNTLKSRR